jgi:hypothetical protein
MLSNHVLALESKKPRRWKAQFRNLNIKGFSNMAIQIELVSLDHEKIH